MLAATHAENDPFGKVKKMIKDLIVKLMEEAKVEKHEADSAQLMTEIKSLSDEVAALKAQQSKATKLRMEEKEKNAVAVKDAETGQAAVEAAIHLLKDFYGVSFAQRSSGTARRKASEVARRAPYTGMAEESTGVIGML